MRPIVLSLSTAALLAVALPTIASSRSARADDVRVVESGGYVLVIPESRARFDVTWDRATGMMTLRQTESSVRLARPPTVILRTERGTETLNVLPVAGHPGLWTVAHDAFKSERYDATVGIEVDGKAYTAPLVLKPSWHPRHGGQVLVFEGCGARAEIVQDLATGALMVYSSDDVQILEAPVVTITETKTPTAIQVNPVPGQPGAWRVVHPAFKTTTVTGRIRILVNGKPCEAALTFVGRHGGRVVSVENGPRIEVVRDAAGRAYTFYVLDETYDGRPVVIEQPHVVWTSPEGPQTVVLTPVEGEPRAYRWIGVDAGVHEPFDGHFGFTLFGKTLDVNLGVSGVGAGVR